MKAAEKLLSWVGKNVVIEGTFPLPVGNGQVAYAPARGKLVAVFDDGFELLEDNDANSTLYLNSNIRSVHPISDIAQVRSKITV